MVEREELARLRKENRQLRLEREVRDRRLFGASGDGILMLDPVTWKITDANLFMTELLGYLREELLGNEIWQFGLLKDENASLAVFRELEQRGSIRYDDLLLKTNDGRTVEVEARYSLYEQDGREVIQGIIRSSNERKQAEEALRQSEDRYRTLYAALPVAAFVCDRSAIIQNYNARAVELWGREPQVGVERHCGSVKLVLPDGSLLPHAQSPMMEVLRTGTPCRNVEVSIERPDGSRVPVIVNFCALKGAQGEVIGVVTTFDDNTERKRTQDELRASLDRFRFMAESMPQKIFTARPSGEVDYFNRQWMEFTGLTFDQIRDWGWTQFIHPDDVDENIRVWKHSIETGEYFQFEHRFRRIDGEYRWHLSRAHAMRDLDGKVLMWIGSNTDIDDMKRADEELKNADRRKNEFLAMLAHELRNPLAPISNVVQVLRHSDGNGESTQMAVEMLGRQVGQMVRLVDELIDVSRIGQGKIELRKGRIELASAVHHAVEAARSSAHFMDHELTVTLPLQPVYLNADPIRLTQILGNLLNNACKFTDKGGHLGLTAERDGGQAVIRVRDSGIGIAADQLPRVFDMFTQLDTSLERQAGGLGIGLTLVKNLVELHGGTVEVQSAGIGQGSEFTVRLPIMVDRTKPSPPEPPTRPPTPGKGRRILVVDDNHDSAESLTMLLKGTGNETHTAYDGREAVEAAATFRPHVVLLDIGLPKLNGYEAAREIREQPWGKAMVLVAVTGWGQVEDRNRSTEAGFNAHMVKPVDYAALEELLATLLP